MAPAVCLWCERQREKKESTAHQERGRAWGWLGGCSVCVCVCVCVCVACYCQTLLLLINKFWTNFSLLNLCRLLHNNAGRRCQPICPAGNDPPVLGRTMRKECIHAALCIFLPLNCLALALQAQCSPGTWLNYACMEIWNTAQGIVTINFYFGHDLSFRWHRYHSITPFSLFTGWTVNIKIMAWWERSPASLQISRGLLSAVTSTLKLERLRILKPGKKEMAPILRGVLPDYAWKMSEGCEGRRRRDGGPFFFCGWSLLQDSVSVGFDTCQPGRPVAHLELLSEHRWSSQL